MTDPAFLAGLVDADPPAAALDDLAGPHGDALRAWQALGLVAREPAAHPAPTCPHCLDGVPARLGDRVVCDRCFTGVDPRHLLAWPLDRAALFAVLAARLGLQGGVLGGDGRLWQLGTGVVDGATVECFYRRPGPLSDREAGRLAAYRRAVVVHGPTATSADGWRRVPLAELLGPDGTPVATGLPALLEVRGVVRFDPATGAVWVGSEWVGEVPVGTKEWGLLAALAEQPDQYVPYLALKREVLRRTGSRDEADAATFCQGLKSRAKRRWLPGIDRLVVSTGKGDGFRLRGHVGR